MTIAIGQLCHRGVILSADTLLSYPDGTCGEDDKIVSFVGASGLFAIANASDDFNATKTMVGSLRDILVRERIANLGRLQAAVSRQMTDWHSAFGQNAPPISSLLLAARLEGDGPRLYQCSPPNTFLQVTDSYVAVGAGAFITDPLNRMLFGTTSEHNPVQVSMRYMSYLMYRAKKDLPGHCGKRTTCVIIGTDSTEPIIATFIDIALAERSAPNLDFLLYSMTTMYLGSSDENMKSNADGIAAMLVGQKDFRATVFHDIYGQQITLSRVIK
jgi:hypothetical protein